MASRGASVSLPIIRACDLSDEFSSIKWMLAKNGGAVVYFAGLQLDPKLLILVSDQAVYLYTRDGQLVRCLEIEFIEDAIRTRNAVGLRVPTEYDARFRLHEEDAEEFLRVLCVVYRRITGRSLPVRTLASEDQMSRNLWLLPPTEYVARERVPFSYEGGDASASMAEKLAERDRELHRAKAALKAKEAGDATAQKLSGLEKSVADLSAKLTLGERGGSRPPAYQYVTMSPAGAGSGSPGGIDHLLRQRRIRVVSGSPDRGVPGGDDNDAILRALASKLTDQVAAATQELGKLKSSPGRSPAAEEAWERLRQLEAVLGKTDDTLPLRERLAQLEGAIRAKGGGTRRPLLRDPSLFSSDENGGSRRRRRPGFDSDDTDGWHDADAAYRTPKARSRSGSPRRRGRTTAPRLFWADNLGEFLRTHSPSASPKQPPSQRRASVVGFSQRQETDPGIEGIDIVNGHLIRSPPSEPKSSPRWDLSPPSRPKSRVSRSRSIDLDATQITPRLSQYRTPRQSLLNANVSSSHHHPPPLSPALLPESAMFPSDDPRPTPSPSHRPSQPEFVLLSCVTQGPHHNVRQQPTASAAKVGEIMPGEVVRVTNSAADSGGNPWVQLDSGGWALLRKSRGSAGEEVFLAPVSMPASFTQEDTASDHILSEVPYAGIPYRPSAYHNSIELLPKGNAQQAEPDLTGFESLEIVEEPTPLFEPEEDITFLPPELAHLTPSPGARQRRSAFPREERAISPPRPGTAARFLAATPPRLQQQRKPPLHSSSQSPIWRGDEHSRSQSPYVPLHLRGDSPRRRSSSPRKKRSSSRKNKNRPPFR
ncbi:hypothetical protein DIPPA_28296 [Diplonema papillatum]|nr:hypothetical protein DIPPA_28296 [Diplonema papillatum]